MTRASTTERGYGNEHQKRKAADKRLVDAGLAYCQQPVCLMPNRWIHPQARWAEGHNDARTAWIGPCHHKCNQKDGARKGGRATAAKKKRRSIWHSRDW